MEQSKLLFFQSTSAMQGSPSFPVRGLASGFHRSMCLPAWTDTSSNLLSSNPGGFKSLVTGLSANLFHPLFLSTLNYHMGTTTPFSPSYSSEEVSVNRCLALSLTQRFGKDNSWDFIPQKFDWQFRRSNLTWAPCAFISILKPLEAPG